MRLAVTGASGKLGRLVVGELLRSVPAADVVLITRDPDAFAGSGVETRRADFDDAAGLPAAFAGVQRALVISTIGTRDAAASHRAAFAAAATAGVEHLVYTSVTNPVATNPFPAAAIHVRSEQDLRECGTAWTILRNSLYAELRVEIAPAYAGAGRWVTNCGGGSHAFVTRADCARAAAAALAADGRAGEIHDVTGPELVDVERYAALVRELAGPVDVEHVDDATYTAYREAFAADPANAAYFELFTGSGTAIRDGHLAVLGTGVADLTGRAPTTLRDAFGGSGRTGRP